MTAISVGVLEMVTEAYRKVVEPTIRVTGEKDLEKAMVNQFFLTAIAMKASLKMIEEKAGEHIHT